MKRHRALYLLFVVASFIFIRFLSASAQVPIASTFQTVDSEIVAPEEDSYVFQDLDNGANQPTLFAPEKFSNSVGHVNQDIASEIGAGPSNSDSPIAPPGFSDEPAPGPLGPQDTPPVSGECTSVNIATLTGPDLIDFLKTHAYTTCLKNLLWTYDSNIAMVYSAQNMISVANEIGAIASSTYVGNNSVNLHQLMVFLRVGFYHKFYHPALWSNPAVITAAISASNSFANNPHFNDSNLEANDILNEWINMLDAASIGHNFIPQLKTIIQQFEQSPTRINISSEKLNVYYVIYLISRAANNNDVNFMAALDSEMLGSIKSLALDQRLIPTYTYIVNNAIWALGQISGASQFNAEAVQHLTTILDTYPRLSEPYTWVVAALDEFNNCQTARPGETICREDIIPDLEAALFTHEYVFDDGALVFKTSLDLAVVQKIYHATKQVEAQFDRLTETTLPIPGDPNGKLTMMIFATQQDYRAFATFMYGFTTNNGGIYIEQLGRFFTYQRTPQQSIYSLEELIRHEYVHYLVGRFTIPGMWGEGPLYANNRMVWFDEGLAELLTWSSQSDGIKTRKLLVEQVRNDGAARMTVRQVLSSTYADTKFYRYAALFFNYLYINDLATLKNLVSLAHASNISGFDSAVNALKNNTTLEQNYQNFLNTMVANVSSLSNPVTIYPEPTTLAANDPAVIQARFRTTSAGYLGLCSVAAQHLNSRFSCRGTITGPLTITPDLTAAWRLFDTKLNQIITTVNTASNPNNFQGMNCRMGRISFVPYQNASSTPPRSYPSSEYYCDGPLGANSFQLLDIAAQTTADFRSTRLGNSTNCSLTSPDNALCAKDLTTTVRPNTAPDSEFTNELADSLIELQSQVYAIRPSYYRDLTCGLVGSSRFVASGAVNKYMAQRVECRIKVTP